MSTPFANPAGMDGLPLDELEGALLIFEPTERVDDINTVHGVPWAVKATVTLAAGFEPSPELTRELQDHVKKVTAPYKYPRIIDYVKELPKTISGKIKRAEIRAKDEA